MVKRLLRRGIGCCGLLALGGCAVMVMPLGVLGRGLDRGYNFTWERIEGAIDRCMRLAED